MFNYQSLFSNKHFINFRTIGENTAIPFFRSGNPSFLTAYETKLLREKLNVIAYYDLRSTSEVAIFGKPQALVLSGIQWIPMSLENPDDPFLQKSNPSDAEYTEFYCRLYSKALHILIEIIAHFAICRKNKETAFFGCFAGKDRTGILSAIILKSLHYDDAAIIDDYMKSETHLQPHLPYFIKHHKLPEWTEEAYTDGIKPRPTAMQSFLNQLNKKDLEQIGRQLSNLGVPSYPS